jgi:uncharacterized protein (DUF1697 family)
MPRHVAFLRGVMPTNAKMPDLKRCFERAGFTGVKTVLSSGNVAFDARARSEAALARRIEHAMAEHLGRVFYTIVRPSEFLRKLVDADPYAAFRLSSDSKRIVTFLGEPFTRQLALPLERDGVRILSMSRREVFTAYQPNPRGPVFMALIEQTFGTNVTTRTWDTVRKCAAA